MSQARGIMMVMVFALIAATLAACGGAPATATPTTAPTLPNAPTPTAAATATAAATTVPANLLVGTWTLLFGNASRAALLPFSYS